MKNKLYAFGMALVLGSLLISGCGTSAVEPTTGLANPASVYCEEQGYTLEMRTDEDGDYGVCIFPDGSECEEWAFYRGECGPAASDAEQPVEVPTVAPTDVPTVAPTDPPTAQPTEAPAPVGPAETWVYVDLAADMTGTTLTWADSLGGAGNSVPAPGARYRVLEEWVYYQEGTSGTVHRVNEAGQDERFDFMVLPESSFEPVDWAISPDGTQIVWNLFTYESTQSAEVTLTTDLYIATIATGETRLLIRHLDEPQILTPWRFTPDGSQVFVYLQLYGIGGFWRGYGAFSALDVATGQLTSLHDPAPEGFFPARPATVISDDMTRLVRFLYVQDQGFRVNLTDLASGQTTEIMALPSELEYVQVGDAVLSPDGSTLIYTVAHGDYGSEGFVMFQVDLAAGTQRELLSLQPNRYKVVRFEDDGSLLLTADRPREERGTWRLHPDGTLEHLSELTLVGVAE